MDRKRIIGEVAARHGVRLEEDDPAFLLVTIAEIALRDAQAEFLDAVRSAVTDQEEAAERIQKSIGETLAISFRRALGESSLAALPRAGRSSGVFVFVGVLSGLLLFATGFFLGGDCR